LKASKPDPLKTAFNLLSYRPRSVHEMRLKLESKGFVSVEVSSTIERLIRTDYLNDEKFAELLAESKTRNKLWGRRKIASELNRRGLSKTVIEDTLQRIDTSAEAETARSALKRWSRRTGLSAPLGKKEVQKAYRHLKARGFSTSMIMPLLRSMEGEEMD
jgi:regulatory protein